MYRFKQYYRLTKPGIIYGNALTAAGGFLLAARGQIWLWQLVSMLIGLSLIVACGCVLNNYIDRGIDAGMARTRKRALVLGQISGRAALVFAVILGLLGAAILLVFSNLLTLSVAVIGLIFYVIIYGVAKRRSVHGTVVGSISGAIPPVVGYVAVTGHLDLAAGLLFSIVTLWQMPHFYAIAIYRLDDYAAVSVPVLPAVRGVHATKIQILMYVAAFSVVASMLTLAGYTGLTYLIVMLGLSLIWLYFAISGFKATNDAVWARMMFRYSLVVILGFCIMLALDAVLP